MDSSSRMEAWRSWVKFTLHLQRDTRSSRAGYNIRRSECTDLKGEVIRGRMSSRADRKCGTTTLIPWRSLRSRSAEFRITLVSTSPLWNCEEDETAFSS